MSDEESKLSLLHAKRDLMFSRVQTISDRAKDLSDPYSRETFLCEIETIDKLRADFENVLDKINEIELRLNPKYSVNYQPLQSFEDLYCRIKRAARAIETETQNKRNFRSERPRLAPIELPNFNGDIKTWPLFYSAFKNIVHENPTLTDSEKLHYLIGKLTNKAQSVFAGITPCAENYKIILNALISKYEDKRLLATSYLEQIFELKPLNIASASNLEQFLEQFATSVSALKNLKVNDLSDLIFLHIALKKLDPETARAFELDRRGSDIPSFDNLVSFVRDQVKILQRTSKQEVTKKGSDRRMDTASKPQSQRSTHTYANTTALTQPLCSLCKTQHEHLYKCPGFQNLTPNERFKFIKSHSYCVNCLSKNHSTSNCNSNSHCHKCQNKHHTMLHFENKNTASANTHPYGAHSSTALAVSAPAPLPPPPPPPASGGERASITGSIPVQPLANTRTDDVALCTFSSNNKNIPHVPNTVLLATARVLMVDAQGNEHSIRALLDSASQSNFISRECCNRLGINPHQKPSCSIVKGIGGSTKSTQGSVHVKFYSRLNKKVEFCMESLVVDKVTERLPTVNVDVTLLKKFENLSLADETYHIPGDIDVLIGASIFPHLLLSEKIQCDAKLYALETLLGYVIIGSAPVALNSATYSTVSYCCSVEPMEAVVRKFWELEEVKGPQLLSPEDKECEDIFCRTTTRDTDGRYTVALPFKDDPSTLGDSRRLAEKCFVSLERKMQAVPKLKQAYDDVIHEYLEKEYISPAPLEKEESIDAPSYIIPHHGVIREDKLTSKLRVVLNASAKTSTSVSLNDILYNGQNLQGNLFNIIVSFRLYRIALSADIKQMFLCIGVRECDRRFQRILYRFAPDEPLKVYQFNRVCFGLTSSPFHALRTIRQLASDEGDSFPKAKDAIQTGLYMDDFVYCVDSEDEATSTAAEMISLMKAGQFDLVKWTSNSQTVLESIPPSHRLASVKEFDESDSHKILGLNWLYSSDQFSLKVCKPADICTKRTILSCVARLWDVMGYVAPIILFAKLLIKELWLCDCDWDDTPPEAIVRQWSRFRNELPLLEQITIPRHVGITKGSEVTIVGFADASEKAYGGVVYFYVENDGVSEVHLISAKSKVAPRKVVSLARLELCAALLLAKLINNIVDACNNRITFKDIFAFSDSTVTLCWIHASPHRWDTFVANRVSKIQSLLSPQTFRHVSGVENSADCLSRGLSPAQIIDHPLWFHGPPWMASTPSEWPVNIFDPSNVHNPPEEKKHTLVAANPQEESPIIALANRVSSWSKLLRCVVYVCRFMKLLPPRQFISAADLIYAEHKVLRELQALYFSDEIAKLRAGKPCSRAFQRLKPFLHDQIIRVGGRLSKSDLNFCQKHPIVLPRKHHIVSLLVDYHHKVNCHAGPDLLMSILRQSYWILSARNLIRNRIHKCIPCFKLRPKSTTPEMSEHKSCRVVQSAKPFMHTGTDYAGPFKVTVARGRGIRSIKAYVCLFVCLTTRAIHIELAGDLSTASFMAAFKRFLSRRGPVGHMYSDNGTNYVGAKRVLSELYMLLTSKNFNTEFAHVLAENRITWSLNTPAASHFGGNWEANIKSLKTHLYRVIGEQILSFEEMSTVLAQVECIMNTRPLCRTLSNDPSEPLALTPAHFLNMTPLRYLPALDIDEDRLHILSRHDLLDKLVQSFWKRWRTEYLHTLQSRDKWNTPANPITVGTVVILNTENSPPLHWPLGIIEEVFPATDGVVRVVKVKTVTGSYLRPVIRLCPLPGQ